MTRTSRSERRSTVTRSSCVRYGVARARDVEDDDAFLLRALADPAMACQKRHAARVGREEDHRAVLAHPGRELLEHVLDRRLLIGERLGEAAPAFEPRQADQHERRADRSGIQPPCRTFGSDAIAKLPSTRTNAATSEGREAVPVQHAGDDDVVGERRAQHRERDREAVHRREPLAGLEAKTSNAQPTASSVLIAGTYTWPL